MLLFVNEIAKSWKLQELDRMIDKLDCGISDKVKQLHITNDCSYENIIIHLTGKSILSFREIIGLCLLGYPDGALSLARNMYEQLIILSFFEYKKSSSDFSDCLQDYFLDSEIKLLKALIFEYKQINVDDQKRAKCEDDLKQCIDQKTHKLVKGDYWWSGHPTFSTLVEDILLNLIDDEDLRRFLRSLHLTYKRACVSIHSSALGNSIRLGNDIDTSVIDTSPKDNGFALPLWFATSCFIMIVGVVCSVLEFNYEDYLKLLNSLALFYKNELNNE